jgi:protein-disulfide isomerase
MARNNPRSVNLGGTPPKPDPSSPSSRESKSEARQRAARLAQDQARSRKRRLLLLQAGIGVLALAVVAAVVVFVLTRSDDPVAAPPQVTSDGAFVVGNPDAPVTLQVVEDFQCPICKQFEATNADLLAQYAAGNDVKIEYRGIAFLDRASTTRYSSRALNASACVMGEGADTWSAFHQAMYEQQPPEQGDGLPDSDLVDIATTAGADPDAVTSCIQDEKYADWTKSTTEKFFDAGGSGTPTLFVNGTELKSPDAATITAAVDKALGK